MPMKKIVEMKEEEDIDGLVELLKAGDTKERAESAKALGILGDRLALGPLLRSLDDEDEEAVRSNVILAIGHIDSERGIEPLIECLKDDSWVIRHDAAIALGHIGNEEAVKALDELLEKEEDIEIKQKAVESLGEIGGEKAHDILMEHLDDISVEEEVIKALVKIDGDEILPHLAQKIKDGEKSVREAAVQGLASIGDEDSCELLVESLKDESWRIREEAAKALGELNYKDAEPKLAEALDDSNQYVVEAALESLGKIGDDETIEVIKRKLDSEKPEIRSSAVKALGETGTEHSTEVLLDRLHLEEHPRVLWVISNSLSSGPNEFRDIIYDRMDEVIGVKEIVLSVSLAKMGDTRVIPKLLDFVDDNRWKIRQKVVEALRCIDLKEVGDNRAKSIIRKLKDALHDNDKWVKVEAIKGLAEMIDEVGDRIDTSKEIEELERISGSEGDQDVKAAIDESMTLLK
ncbi:MAG: HEAT repeat domain-containing protein [Candidatus Saliniplasma sp.]